METAKIPSTLDNAARRRGFLLLLISLIVEGYDLQAANFAAPDLVASFGVARSALGPLLSASLVGLLIGAVLLAPLGDRIGRKRVIVIACICYGLFSLAAAMSPSLSWLIFWRLAIGAGLGAVLPNALAHAGELASDRLQASATGLVGVGITIGGVLAGIVAAQLLPEHGWRSLFFVGGVLPIIVAALLIWGLPESPALQLQPTAGKADRKDQPSVWAIIRPSMMLKTIGVWLIFAFVLMNVYLLSGWIPLLMADAGFSQRSSALIATGYHLGGVGGGVAASLLLKEKGWAAVAFLAFFAAASLGALTLGAGVGPMLAVLVIAAGFCVTGTQNAANGAASATYPPEIRAAGLGWALGFGRLGSIAGPLIGSFAIMLGLQQPHQFFALPLAPLVIAALIALWLHRAAAIRR